MCIDLVVRNIQQFDLSHEYERSRTHSITPEFDLYINVTAKRITLRFRDGEKHFNILIYKDCFNIKDSDIPIDLSFEGYAQDEYINNHYDIDYETYQYLMKIWKKYEYMLGSLHE